MGIVMRNINRVYLELHNSTGSSIDFLGTPCLSADPCSFAGSHLRGPMVFKSGRCERLWVRHTLALSSSSLRLSSAACFRSLVISLLRMISAVFSSFSSASSFLMAFARLVCSILTVQLLDFTPGCRCDRLPRRWPSTREEKREPLTPLQFSGISMLFQKHDLQRRRREEGCPACLYQAWWELNTWGD